VKTHPLDHPGKNPRNIRSSGEPKKVHLVTFLVVVYKKTVRVANKVGEVSGSSALPCGIRTEDIGKFLILAARTMRGIYVRLVGCERSRLTEQ
jgi:hypothetical protein